MENNDMLSSENRPLIASSDAMEQAIREVE